MRHLFLFSFLLLCLTCGKVQCQNTEASLRYQIDSLDNVQPLHYPNTKSVGRPYVIKVRNQEQFNEVGKLILDATKAGRMNIVVKIGKGNYLFHENHINLANLKQEEVSITIKGCNTVISSDQDYSNDNYCTSPWGELTTADGLIEVVDEERKLCKIPFLNSMKDTDKSSYKQVQITQWFKAPKYEVERVDDSGVYFFANDLEYIKQFGRSGYNVNYDYLCAGKIPRFRLSDSRKVRPCIAACFLRINNSTLRSITLQGISFNGNKEGSSLFAMSSVKASAVVIQKCSFDYIRNTVASFSSTGNVVFNKNIITHTSGNELSFSGECKNVRVTNCRFENCGAVLGNTMCVRCNGGEYYIGNNVFCNFGYSAIGVGLWHGHEKKHDIRGIIEHNEIYFTDDYFAHREKYTLMDAGAIYVWTQNDDAIIRYNYIHDYGGMRFNSGLYCDDGASNCKIYGNIVLNVPDGCCITSRKVKDMKSAIKNNANNFMAGNVVDGAVVFAGYGAEERHCVKGANYVVKGKKIDGNKFENLEENQPDIEIEKPTIKTIRSKYIKNWKIRE